VTNRLFENESNGKVSHGDDMNPEGAINNGIKDKEKRYRCPSVTAMSRSTRW